MLICFFIAIISSLISDFVGIHILNFDKSPISAITVAILIGLLSRYFVKNISIFNSGYQFCIKKLLKVGIIFLGIKISLSEIVNFSANSLIVVIPCIVLTLLGVLNFRKYFSITEKMGLLIGVGTSICGATAIVATAPVINAKKEDVSYAIANITLFGLFSMILYPFLAKVLFSNDSMAIGLFLGSAIHDTSQVTGSAMIYSEQFDNKDVLKIAMVTKLIRNTAMAIVIPFIAIKYNSDSFRKGIFLPKFNLFPIFILGFIFFGMLRTFGDYNLNHENLAFGLFDNLQWNKIVLLISSTSQFLLIISMSAIGLTTDLGGIKKMGIRIFYFGFAVALLVGVLSITIINIFIL